MKRKKIRKLIAQENKRHIEQQKQEGQQLLQQAISNIPEIQKQLSHNLNPSFSTPIADKQGTFLLLAAMASPNATSALTGLSTTTPRSALTSPLQTLIPVQNSIEHCHILPTYILPKKKSNNSFPTNKPVLNFQLVRQEKIIVTHLSTVIDYSIALIQSRDDAEHQLLEAFKDITDDYDVDTENNPFKYRDAEFHFDLLKMRIGHLSAEPEKGKAIIQGLNTLKDKFSKSGYFYRRFMKNPNDNCIAKTKKFLYHKSMDAILNLVAPTDANKLSSSQATTTTSSSSTVTATYATKSVPISSTAIRLNNKTEGEAVPSLSPTKGEEKKTSTSVTGIVGAVAGTAALIVAGIGFFKYYLNRNSGRYYTGEKGDIENAGHESVPLQATLQL